MSGARSSRSTPRLRGVALVAAGVLVQVVAAGCGRCGSGPERGPAAAAGAAPEPITPAPAPTPAPEPTTTRGAHASPLDGAPEPPPIDVMVAALLADAAEHDYSSRPGLLAQLEASPHAFFRAVNVAFADCTCRSFRARFRDSPEVNLHGDAHLEQYAVTDEGRGLTDFDDATTGPAIVDGARIIVSIRLALHERGWEASTDAVLDRLAAGYLAGLRTPDAIPDAPAYVRRVRAASTRPRSESLSAAERAMRPLTPERERAARAGLAAYATERLALDPALAPDTFRVKRLGALGLGIGSALDEKYLFRVEGPSPAADDDLLLEAKEVRSLEGISCLRTAQDANPLRILIASSRLAYEPYEHVGYFRGDEHNFWIHAWQTNYQELAILPGRTSSLESPDELAEVAYDAGFQLGRGHPLQVGAPFEDDVRRLMAQRTAADLAATGPELDALFRAVLAAWEEFRRGDR